MIVKGSVKVHDFLEYMKNRDKDEKIKLNGPDGRIEEYMNTYNVPENHEQMTVDEVLEVMCPPEDEQED